MNCQECRDLFDDMLDRRMKEPLRQRMQIHLMNCTECNIRFEQWRKAHAALFRALNHFDGLEHLQEGFADRLVAECRRPQHWWQDVSVPKCALIAASLLLLAGFVFAAAEVGGRLYSTGETSPGNDDAAMAQKGEKATEETETTAADSVADYVTVPSVPVVPSVSLTTSTKGETEMTKKNTAAAALSAAMAAAPLAAATLSANVTSARAVAWYHFDEQPAGCQTTAGDTFVNAVDGSQYPAEPHIWTDDYQLTTTGQEMPRYADGFGAGYYVYDPVENNVFANTGSVFVASAVTNAYGSSGVVTIPDDATFYGDAFTIEFFLKCAKFQSSVWETFFSRVNSSGGYSLVLRQLNGNVVGTCAFVTNGVLTEMKLADMNLWEHGSLLNEKWHHVAITMDQTAFTLKLYIDYQCLQTVNLPGPLAVSDSSFIRLGAGIENFGHFDGSFDEFRISDKVLTIDQFLKVQRMDNPNVYYYHSFTPIDTVFDSIKHAFRNEVEPASSAYVLADTPKSFEHVKSWSDDAFYENSHVCNIQSSSDSTVLSIPINDYDVCTNDFTAEAFFRVPSGGANSPSYIFNFANGVRARFEGDTLKCLNASWGGGFTMALADGCWHHLAYVIDRANGKVKVYVDYVLKWDYSYTVGAVASGSKFYFGSFDGWSNKFKELWLDEVRITKSALDASKFLRPAGVVDGGSCIITFSKQDFASYGLGLNGKPVERPAAWGSYTLNGENLPGAVIYNGIDDRIGNTNEVSAGFVGNGGGFSGFYKVPDDIANPLADGSFTAEMFVCLGGFGGGGVNEYAHCFIGQSGNFRVVMLADHSVAALDSAGNSFASYQLMNNKWYHFAYVQDNARNELRFYVNGRMVGIRNGIPARTGALGSYIYLMCNPAKDFYGSFTSAWADEIRFTRRALEPVEFLSAKLRRGFCMSIR